jgi:hypothetical protein
LPQRQIRQDVIGEMHCRRPCAARCPRDTRRARYTRSDQQVLAALRASRAGKAVGKDSALRGLRPFNPDVRPLVGITRGGARNVARENPLRHWPLSLYGTLTDELRNRGFAVVLTGDRTDGRVWTEFRDPSGA